MPYEPKFKWEEFALVLAILLLFIAFSIGGCASLPTKPSVDVCGLYVQDEIGGVCAPSEDKIKSEVDLEYQNIIKMIDTSDGTYFKPVGEMHGYICTSPDDWYKIAEYIANLKRIIIRNCRK